MGDEGMDPCECLWNHEFNMRRLLSLLRQGQSYCTDNECLEELPGPQGSTAGGNFMVMYIMMAVAIVMYMMRPSRNRSIEATKSVRDSSDGEDGPPAPPRIQ